MEQKSTETQPSVPLQQAVERRPNEQGVLNIDDFLRIFDPNTQQVLLEKRS